MLNLHQCKVLEGINFVRFDYSSDLNLNHYKLISEEYYKNVKCVRGGGNSGLNKKDYNMEYFREKQKEYSEVKDKELKRKKESSTTIIIPYRPNDIRKSQLDYFINNSVPLLIKYIPNCKILIVEQDFTHELFNRGLLINIGVKESDTKYIITHDIDINPLDKTIIKYYTNEINSNTIEGIYTYIDSLGGIIKCHKSTFLKINGFPNEIWGWGAEDIHLQKRAENINLNIIKHFNNSQKLNNYFNIFNNSNDRNKSNHKKNLKQQFNCGINNNLEYTILHTQNINEHIKIIKVKIL